MLLVKTSIVGCCMFVPRSWCHFAGLLDILVGSVKIQKHLAKLFLIVIVRLNRIALFSALALMFRSFLDLVSDRFLWW